MGRRIKHYWTHMTHCNAGEEVGYCKYGSDNKCPTLKPDSIQNEVRARLKEAWKKAVLQDRTELSFRLWTEDAPEASREWRAMYDKIYAEIDKEKKKK